MFLQLMKMNKLYSLVNLAVEDQELATLSIFLFIVHGTCKNRGEGREHRKKIIGEAYD